MQYVFYLNNHRRFDMSALGFQHSLGIHQQALLTRAERSEILANNLANSDTPGFKSRDMDFQAVLRGEQKKHHSLGVNQTHDGHLPGVGFTDFDLMYRTPTQPSLDGNTVDDNLENSEFTKNAMAYNASFEFINSRFKGLTSAIRGD